jgi:4-amino-4-deoxychorismate lyase
MQASYLGCERVSGISPANRGLAYGDGLFETMRVQAGALPLWPQHLARLREGAQRLNIALPDVAFIESQIDIHIAGCEAGVLKLLLTRGDGGRGYAPPADALSVWQLALHPLPEGMRDGLRLHLCDTRMAIQPVLAGIKHCNRLEQVLARREVELVGCDEGLMLDSHGRVVSATSANLLLYRDGRWLTPSVKYCGVAGVLRGWLLAQELIEVAELTVAMVQSADALALCNAMRGILSVSWLGEQQWRAHPAISDLQKQLVMAYPMFSLPESVA